MGNKAKFILKYINRFQNKIALIAIISSLLGLFLSVGVSYYGIQALFKDSTAEMKKGINVVTKEYTENYINMTKDMLQGKLQKFIDEQSILADSFQRYLDNTSENNDLLKDINILPSKTDNFKFNGRWIQNSNLNTSVVLIEKYLLDKNNQIRPDVLNKINNAKMLDLIMPSVYNNGAKKLWIYYQGGIDSSFLKIYPWNNAGASLDKVYPAFTNKEIWEAFNPGLVKQWEEKIKNLSKSKLDLSKLAIVKSPAQDGGTGNIVMTISFPLWDLQRTKFQGSIGFDVELTEFINYIEKVKMAQTGFAYLSQSNGNVFAMNDNGVKLLGLKNVKDATIKGKNGADFNIFQRFLKDSSYDAVRTIKLPLTSAITQEEIKINGKDYIIIQKNLDPNNTWSKEKGFHTETWTLGFVIPKDEFYSSYTKANNQIDVSKRKVLGVQFLLAILTIVLIGAGIFITARKMTKNLRKLELAAIEITNKNYDVCVNIDSKDEIGRLGDTINDMIIEIKTSFQQMKIQNEILQNEIEERQERERQIRYLEEYDALTNLPNQNLLVKLIDEKVNLIEKDSKIVTIIIGIDNFRNVNEVFGLTGGNGILVMLAKRLRALVEDTGIVARINGDEFAMIYYNIHSLDEVAKKVESILNAVKQKFLLNGKEIYISACAGISTYPTDSKNVNELIRTASSALIYAKAKGYGNYQFYDVETNKSAEERINMIIELRNSIEKDELELWYQPQINIKTKKCIGMEALVRWNSSVYGKVMPNIFIPLAEETGLIFNIGEWVLRNACLQAKKWHDDGYKNLKVAVNLSPLQFTHEKIVDVINNIIDETGISRELLELEVTESLFISNIENVVFKLNELRKTGITIAVDDFGTGYSSLCYIKKLPIDKLKIDRSFINEIPYKDDGSIANAIINLGHNLNIKVVAEGVETKEQEKLLLDGKCYEAQGYYYSKPLPAMDFMEKIKKDFI